MFTTLDPIQILAGAANVFLTEHLYKTCAVPPSSIEAEGEENLELTDEEDEQGDADPGKKNKKKKQEKTKNQKNQLAVRWLWRPDGMRQSDVANRLWPGERGEKHLLLFWTSVTGVQQRSSTNGDVQSRSSRKELSNVEG